VAKMRATVFAMSGKRLGSVTLMSIGQLIMIVAGDW
jgi:hypothetical protein